MQIAVIAAPIVCGTLGEKVAGTGASAPPASAWSSASRVYLAGRRWLPPEPARGAAAKKAAGARPGMTGAEKARLALLIALIPVLMLSIVGNQQFNNAFPLWARKHMDFVLFGWQVPVTWLQAVDAAVGTATMVGSIAFWRWWATRRREPDELVKMGLGALLAAGAPALIVYRLDPGRDHGREGEPRLDPRLHARQRSRLRQHPAGGPGAVFACRAEGAPGTGDRRVFPAPVHRQHPGRLARGIPETMPGRQFWALHAGLVAAAGVLLLACRLAFGGLLAPEEVEKP